VENPEPGRAFPWGNEPDPNRGNCDETGVGTTSAVGCFPGGASPYGVEDLSGNVWEWTRSLYRGYPYDPGDGREDLESGDLRVLRGGAFYVGARFVRCAYRDWYNPSNRDGRGGFRLVASPVHL
jgi:formylglycine-generating enzyme required for sulfatase activity